MPGPRVAVGAVERAGRLPARRRGDALACPWHGWEYDLATGQSFLGPGEPGVKSYDVNVEPGERLAGREPGPYVAETFPVHVEEDYVVIDA